MVLAFGNACSTMVLIDTFLSALDCIRPPSCIFFNMATPLGRVKQGTLKDSLNLFDTSYLALTLFDIPKNLCAREETSILKFSRDMKTLVQ